MYYESGVGKSSLSREERTKARRNRSPAPPTGAAARAAAKRLEKTAKAAVASKSSDKSAAAFNNFNKKKKLYGAAKRQAERRQAAAAAAAAAAEAEAAGVGVRGVDGLVGARSAFAGGGDRGGTFESAAAAAAERSAEQAAEHIQNMWAAKHFGCWSDVADDGESSGAVAAAAAAAETAAALLKRGETPIKQDEAENANTLLSGLATAFHQSSAKIAAQAPAESTAERWRSPPQSSGETSENARAGEVSPRASWSAGPQQDDDGGVCARSKLTVSASRECRPPSPLASGSMRKIPSPLSSPLSSRMITPQQAMAHHNGLRVVMPVTYRDRNPESPVVARGGGAAAAAAAAAAGAVARRIENPNRLFWPSSRVSDHGDYKDPNVHHGHDERRSPDNGNRDGAGAGGSAGSGNGSAADRKPNSPDYCFGANGSGPADEQCAIDLRSWNSNAIGSGNSNSAPGVCESDGTRSSSHGLGISDSEHSEFRGSRGRDFFSRSVIDEPNVNDLSVGGRSIAGGGGVGVTDRSNVSDLRGGNVGGANTDGPSSARDFARLDAARTPPPNVSTSSPRSRATGESTISNSGGGGGGDGSSCSSAAAVSSLMLQGGRHAHVNEHIESEHEHNNGEREREHAISERTSQHEHGCAARGCGNTNRDDAAKNGRHVAARGGPAAASAATASNYFRPVLASATGAPGVEPAAAADDAGRRGARTLAWNPPPFTPTPSGRRKSSALGVRGCGQHGSGWGVNEVEANGPVIGKRNGEGRPPGQDAGANDGAGLALQSPRSRKRRKAAVEEGGGALGAWDTRRPSSAP